MPASSVDMLPFLALSLPCLLIPTVLCHRQRQALDPRTLPDWISLALRLWWFDLREV